MPSRRGDSVGGGSSRIFPWSPKADAIQWGGGGGSSRIFRGLGGGVVAEFSVGSEIDAIQWGGGVVAAFFRGLLNSTPRFSGGE